MVRAGDSALNVIEKVEEVLGGKTVFVKGLKTVVVRDVGGERGAWGEEEKERLRRECVRWGVKSDFRSAWE